MVDDQDRCEWVNVSSGTGSPGKSRTKGHKTVVVVVLKTDALTQAQQIHRVPP